MNFDANHSLINVLLLAFITPLKQFPRLGQPTGNARRGFSNVFRYFPPKSAMENGKGANRMLEKVKIYRVTGDEAEMISIDARRAVEEHPNEWSYQPWTKEQQQDALEKSLQADINTLDA